MPCRLSLADNPPGSRAWDWATIGPYEIICPACGDNPALNYAEVPLEIQDIRGNHVTLHEARQPSPSTPAEARDHQPLD